MRGWIEGFERVSHDLLGDTARDLPEALASSALPVDPARVAVVDPAGAVDPGLWLPADMGNAFYNYRARRLSEPSLPVPKGCYMVTKSRERELRHKLLSSKMAVLIPEDDIPRHSDGSLMLSGLFAVPHKAASDRLIFDRRPANPYDLRLAWAHLPLGAQLCQLVLRSDEVCRGSGDDLRTFFYCLANAEEAVPYNCFGRRAAGDAEWAPMALDPG